MLAAFLMQRGDISTSSESTGPSSPMERRRTQTFRNVIKMLKAPPEN